MKPEADLVREALPTGLIEALEQPRAYPLDPASMTPGGDCSVEHVQTHLSHVFLTQDRVYKLRKAIHLPFVSFGTRVERNTDCMAEVALNRRLAPDVYLGVAPILTAGGQLQVGPVTQTLAVQSPPCEHLVVMRRLQETDKALEQLAAGRFGARQIDAIASLVSRFHRDSNLTNLSTEQKTRLLERTSQVVADASLADGPGGAIESERLASLRRSSEYWFERIRDRFQARIKSGHIVNGHGDLHLDHIYFEARPGESEPRRPIAIDCIEFNSDLRFIDAASEIAFPAMDLRYRGRGDLGERLLRQYAMESDDYGLYGVIDYFQMYRALVRAGVAAVAARDGAIDPEQRVSAARSASAHFELAEDFATERGKGCVILSAGSIGTGKSSAAESLADRLECVVVASDAVRKHLAGVELHADAAENWGRGIYDKHWHQRVYEALFERAARVLESGRSVILDATFALRSSRNDARRFAAEHDVPIYLMHCTCDPSIVQARLVERKARGGALSDAGPEELPQSIARFEAPSEWPASDLYEIDTANADWEHDVEKLYRKLECAPQKEL